MKLRNAANKTVFFNEIADYNPIIIIQISSLLPFFHCLQARIKDTEGFCIGNEAREQTGPFGGLQGMDTGFEDISVDIHRK